MYFLKKIINLKKIDNLNQINQFHLVYKMLRAYVLPIHVHKTPLIFPALQMLKRPETYFQHPMNGLINLKNDSLTALIHQILTESEQNTKYRK